MSKNELQQRREELPRRLDLRERIAARCLETGYATETKKRAGAAEWLYNRLAYV